MNFKFNYCALMMLAGLFTFCSSETTSSSTTTATVTIGAYTQSGSDYIDTGKDIEHKVGVTYYTWTRTAQNDAHQSATHDHYNAGTNSSYANDTFTWTEFGPELSQSEIDTTCAGGQDGVTKSVTSTTYYEETPGLYLKIKSTSGL